MCSERILHVHPWRPFFSAGVRMRIRSLHRQWILSSHTTKWIIVTIKQGVERAKRAPLLVKTITKLFREVGTVTTNLDPPIFVPPSPYTSNVMDPQSKYFRSTWTPREMFGPLQKHMLKVHHLGCYYSLWNFQTLPGLRLWWPYS